MFPERLFEVLFQWRDQLLKYAVEDDRRIRRLEARARQHEKRLTKIKRHISKIQPHSFQRLKDWAYEAQPKIDRMEKQISLLFDRLNKLEEL